MSDPTPLPPAPRYSLATPALYSIEHHNGGYVVLVEADEGDRFELAGTGPELTALAFNLLSLVTTTEAGRSLR